MTDGRFVVVVIESVQIRYAGNVLCVCVYVLMDKNAPVAIGETINHAISQYHQPSAVLFRRSK